jgi:hypothetical protein
VIDMRDDAEISLELWVHVPVLPAGAEGRKPPARDFQPIRDGSTE